MATASPDPKKGAAQPAARTSEHPFHLKEGKGLDLARFAFGFQRDPLRCFQDTIARLGPTAVLPLPRRGLSETRPLFITVEPELIRAVLTDSRFRNSSLALSGPRDSSHRRLRNSVFRMHGKEHMRHRRVIGPTLQKRAMGQYHASMLRVVDEFFANWKADEERDLAKEMKDLARHISATTLFGLDNFEESARIGHMIEDWWGDNFSLPLRAFAHDLPGTPYRAMLRKADKLEKLVREMIERKRSTGLGEGDMLTGLIRARDENGGISEDELLGETHILFLAAHETTAYALTWTLFLLAQHPVAAQRVCDEIDAKLGRGLPSLEAVNALPELDRVIDESLRILPIIPYGARIASQDLQLEGLDMPRKSRVLIPFHLLHHDASVFPEPRRFDPTRWLNFEPPPYRYLPFSAGLHMCIGVNFAKLSMRMALAVFLQRFRLRVREGARVDKRTTVTLAPRHAIPVGVLPHTGAWRASSIRGDIQDLVDFADPADRS